MRTLATGGTLPPKQAVKRPRQTTLDEGAPANLVAAMQEEPDLGDFELATPAA